MGQGEGRRGCSAAPPGGTRLELTSGELPAGAGSGAARRGSSRAGGES
jgi:hypothetical protein